MATKVIDRFDGPYRFLSNFARLPDGSTLEHYYQAAKARAKNEADWVMAASTPALAKHRGRLVKMRAEFDQIKNSVMLRLLRTKFAVEPTRSMLLATGDAQLVEGNTWHDQYWGSCTCPMHYGVTGANWLGKLLMQVRGELKEEGNDGSRESVGGRVAESSTAG